jgi:hypothetical protein
VTRWQRYWFDEGGRTSLAIVRVAVALSVLLGLRHLAYVTSFKPLYVADLYRPVGIWMLLGDTAPAAGVVNALWLVAWVATAAMLLGLATRVSTVVSFVAALALVSLSFSASRTWSHQYNVVFLAQMAMLGSRSGDTLSIDWLIRRVRKLPAHDVPRAYQWSLRLVQLAVALMFAGAVFHKLLHSHLTLRWALSDNLRHHLLVKYDLADLVRPPLVDWLIAEPWRYRTAAVLNMISQAAPLAAVVFVRRPWVRAGAAVFFVIETIALGLVVQLWNLHWLPLAAVFIDWDRLIGRITGSGISVPVLTAPYRPSRAIRIWVVVFFFYQTLTAFVPTLDQRLNTYPFSGFPMFATLRVRAPYDQHLPYSIAGDYMEVISDRTPDPPTQRWFDHSHRGIFAVRNPGEVRRRLAALLELGQKRYWDFGVKGLRSWLAIYETPPYPAPANFERHPIAIVGELLPDGTFNTLLGTQRGNPGTPNARIELPRALDGAKVVYYRDDVPTPIELTTITGNTIDLAKPIDGSPLYVVAIVDGKPWLVASYTASRW